MDASGPEPRFLLPELSGAVKRRFIKPEGMHANLNLLYGSNDREVCIYVKWGNIRHKNGWISINVQKQLEELRLTYKPWGTHITIAKFISIANAREADEIVATIADQIGNKAHRLTLRYWGRHSVLLCGPFLQSITLAITNVIDWRVELVNPIHIELIPKLKKGEEYQVLAD